MRNNKKLAKINFFPISYYEVYVDSLSLRIKQKLNLESISILTKQTHRFKLRSKVDPIRIIFRK